MNCVLDNVKDKEGISDYRYSHYKKQPASVEPREANEDVRIRKMEMLRGEILQSPI